MNTIEHLWIEWAQIHWTSLQPLKQRHQKRCGDKDGSFLLRLISSSPLPSYGFLASLHGQGAKMARKLTKKTCRVILDWLRSWVRLMSEAWCWHAHLCTSLRKWPRCCSHIWQGFVFFCWSGPRVTSKTWPAEKYSLISIIHTYMHTCFIPLADQGHRGFWAYTRMHQAGDKLFVCHRD